MQCYLVLEISGWFMPEHESNYEVKWLNLPADIRDHIIRDLTHQRILHHEWALPSDIIMDAVQGYGGLPVQDIRLDASTGTVVLTVTPPHDFKLDLLKDILGEGGPDTWMESDVDFGDYFMSLNYVTLYCL